MNHLSMMKIKLNLFLDREWIVSLQIFIFLGVWASIDYIPILKEKTNCLSESMYKQLIEKVPPVFRLALWEIKYDFVRDGASF